MRTKVVQKLRQGGFSTSFSGAYLHKNRLVTDKRDGWIFFPDILVTIFQLVLLHQYCNINLPLAIVSSSSVGMSLKTSNNSIYL